VVAQRVDDLGVDERQQPVALVDQGHAHAERGEDAGVLAADHPGADHRQGPRQPVELQDVVAGEDLLAVERDMAVARRLGAGCDDDLVRRDRAGGGAVDVLEPQLLRPAEHRGRRDQLDPVAHQLVAGHVDLVLDDLVGAHQQVLHRDVLLDRVGRAVEFARAVARQLQHRFAQRLRRDCAEVDADPAEHGGALDDRDPLVELCALDRRPLAGRAGADHQEVVVVALRHRFPQPRSRRRGAV
jgi:hypothetical protein